MTNNDLFLSFARGATSGKNGNGTLFIRGNTIFSYNDSWPIAARVGNIVYGNRDRFSVTTSKQTSQLLGRCAIAGLTVENVTKAEVFKHIKA